MYRHKVFIIDDHPIVRQGLSRLIDQEHDLITCGEAGNVQDAMDGMAACAPDVLLVDISLQGGSGIELLKALKAEGRQTPSLVLSMHDETLYAERALRAGAKGYVMKQEATESMLTAIRQVLLGEIYLSARMREKLRQGLLCGFVGTLSPLELLSDRELEVLRLIGQGRVTGDIARELNRSVKTVDSHRSRIKEKLGLKNGAELARFAVQWAEGEREGV